MVNPGYLEDTHTGPGKHEKSPEKDANPGIKPRTFFGATTPEFLTSKRSTLNRLKSPYVPHSGKKEEALQM